MISVPFLLSRPADGREQYSVDHLHLTVMGFGDGVHEAVHSKSVRSYRLIMGLN